MGMALAVRRFTVDEYHRMADAGILHEDDRVELLDGQIVEMGPIGPRHVACVIRLSDLLGKVSANLTIVSVQNPLVLEDRSEPQPDIVLLGRPADLSGAWLPGHANAWLVIEVADTSLARDRDKLRLYAESGVPEVWLVNLPEDTVEVYRDPAPEAYATVRTTRRGDTLTPLRLQGATFRVDDILG